MSERRDTKDGRRVVTVLNDLDVNVKSSDIRKDDLKLIDLMEQIRDELLLIRLHLEIVTGEDIKVG